ncbi:MAG: hypothetical protein Q9160_007398 [Pyrenula sp. 1 TL-2023]
MPVKSLLELAQQAGIRCAKEIDNFGDAPYKLIRPIIAKIENPHQLHSIEANNPEYEGESSDKWMEFIKRDIPGWDQKSIYPKDGKDWYKLYRKLRRRAAKEEEESANLLGAQLSELNAIKAENVAHIDLTMKHSDKKVKKAVPTSNWRKGPSYVHRRMITPTHSLNHLPRQIVQAPSSFVEDAKRKIEPRTLPPVGRALAAPRQASSASVSNPTPNTQRNSSRVGVAQSAITATRPRPAGSIAHRKHSQATLAEREARLRALISGRSGNIHPPRPDTLSTGREDDKRIQEEETRHAHNSSSSIRASTPASIKPPNSGMRSDPLTPPPTTTTKRRRDELQQDIDDTKPEIPVKRSRTERPTEAALTSPRNLVCPSHSEATSSSSRQLTRISESERRTTSPEDVVSRTPDRRRADNSLVDRNNRPTPPPHRPSSRASPAPAKPSRPKASRPPSHSLLRKKRPMPP